MASTTNPKRTAPATAPATEASAFAADAEQAEAQYAQAKALAEQDEQDLAAAIEHEAAVRNDRSSTPEDLARAVAAVSLTEGHKRDSAAKLTQAARRRINTSTDLGEALVTFVAEVVGVTPTVQPFTPTSPLPVPSLVIVQRKSAQLWRSGALSGEVEVRFYRERLHREMNAGAFQRHAERHRGLTVTAAHSLGAEVDGVRVVETVRLVVSGVFPELPAITPGSEENGLHHLRADVTQEVGARSSYRHDGPLSGADSGHRQGISAEGQTSVASDTTTGDTRTMVVDATFTGHPVRSGTTWSLDRIREEIERAALLLDGRAVQGLGRVREVQLKGTKLLEDGKLTPIRDGLVMLGDRGGYTRMDGIAVAVRFVVDSLVLLRPSR